tara:strand:+ start:4159 stop:4887 length:729 start_codon:yes stop_codon:yes gene_type:complete
MSKNQAGDGFEYAEGNWKFSGPSLKNFTKHIRKSVPLYDEGHSITAKFSENFVSDKSVCYELGCSTGVLISLLSDKHLNAHWVGIDIEQDMINQASKEVINGKSLKDRNNLKLICEDITSYNFEPSPFIVSYLTIQFIDPKLRLGLIKKIYDSLLLGGAFVFFEKIKYLDLKIQNMNKEIYDEFKIKNGFSLAEIQAKEKSLKGNLIPFTKEENIDLAKEAGFSQIDLISKWSFFEGYLCIK